MEVVSFGGIIEGKEEGKGVEKRYREENSCAKMGGEGGGGEKGRRHVLDDP